MVLKEIIEIVDLLEGTDGGRSRIVVGVAITSEVPIPGCATGVTQFIDIELASRFVFEVAKAFGERRCSFYDQVEFEQLLRLYGPMTHLQILP